MHIAHSQHIFAFLYNLALFYRLSSEMFSSTIAFQDFPNALTLLLKSTELEGMQLALSCLKAPQTHFLPSLFSVLYLL